MSDDILVYPTNRVAGVAPDAETLDVVHEALRATGVAADRVEVLCDDRAAEALDTGTEDHGPLASAIRTVQQALGEETHRLAALSGAIEAGGYVVLVEIPDDDELRDVEKRSVGNALLDAGADRVAFYGRLAVEELQIGA